MLKAVPRGAAFFFKCLHDPDSCNKDQKAGNEFRKITIAAQLTQLLLIEAV